MVYRVNFFDDTSGENYITVQDGTLNKETHLTFVGKNWYGYGETIAENQLHLLENFAGTNEPDVAKAVTGQLWYRKDAEAYSYFDGTKWSRLKLDTVATREILDNVGQLHTVTLVFDPATYVGETTEIISIFSADDDFVVNISESDIQPDFPEIKRGQTMSIKSGYKFHGTATSAQYADLAEYYSSDADYEPGTVLKLGGEAEVTQTTLAFCPEVFGVVSTEPAYLMNSKLEGTRVAVAMAGRVPVKVIGQVKKGQRLLASEEPGVARAPTDYEMQEYMDWYRIVGRALEDKTTEGIGLVEVAVGAK